MVDLKIVDVQLNELPKLPMQSIGYHSNFVYNNKYYVLGGVSAEYEIRKFDTNYNSPQQKTFPRHKLTTRGKSFMLSISRKVDGVDTRLEEHRFLIDWRTQES